MAASRRSLLLTEAHRARILALRERLQTLAAQRWPSIEQLDQTDWADRMATALAAGQAEAVRASSGYLTAYLSTELGRRVRGPMLLSRDYAGRSRDGRPLTDSLRSPLIGVLAALKEGQSPSEALRVGLSRAQRMVETDLMHAARESLRAGMERDERIKGWQRSVKGTCGACMGDIAVEVSVQLPGVPLRVHPGCLCTTVPVVTGVRDLFPLPTGQQLFERMGRAEQDEGLGSEAAERVRAGEIGLTDLVGESRLETAENFLTQKPLDAVST